MGQSWVPTAQDPEPLPAPPAPRGLKAHPAPWPLGKFPELFSASETLPCAIGAVDFPICPVLGAAAAENCCPLLESGERAEPWGPGQRMPVSGQGLMAPRLVGTAVL